MQTPFAPRLAVPVVTQSRSDGGQDGMLTAAKHRNPFCINSLVKSSAPAAQETRRSRVAPPPGTGDRTQARHHHVGATGIAAVRVRDFGTLAACVFVFLRSVPRPGDHHRPVASKAATGSNSESVTARNHGTHRLYFRGARPKRQGRRTRWPDALVRHDDVRARGAATTSWRRAVPDETPFATRCWNATPGSWRPS